MRPRHVVAPLFVLLALILSVSSALAAPAISFPDTVAYGDDPDLIVTGLTPGASYLFNLYEPNGGHVQTFDFQAGPDGTY